MAEVINLNKARKAKSREADKAKANANRAAFGRTKADKDAERLKRERLERALDGARRETPEKDQV